MVTPVGFLPELPPCKNESDKTKGNKTKLKFLTSVGLGIKNNI